MARGFKFGTGCRGQTCQKQLKIPKMYNLYSWFFLMNFIKFYILLIIKFSFMVFGCQTKVQSISKQCIFQKCSISKKIYFIFKYIWLHAYCKVVNNSVNTKGKKLLLLILVLIKGSPNKLDGLSPVDNRPSTKKVYHFVRKKLKNY